MTVTPLDILLIASIPMLVLAVVAVWLKWRDDHRGHPAE